MQVARRISPQLTASKKVESTVLQQQETEFCPNGVGFDKDTKRRTSREERNPTHSLI